MTVEAARPARRRWRTRILFFAGLLVLWEGVKVLGGDPFRVDGQVVWDPPLKIAMASDINLPHVWDVVGAFGVVDAAGNTFISSLAGSALFTLRGALVGFLIGAVVGLGLAIVLVHVRILERALVPLVVASQTIPIVALAPIIVVGLQAGWFGIAIVASYLTFFPVTVAAIRGLRAADPRAFELMRSYAAGRRSTLRLVRLPAASPYLFTAFKVSATASIVGAIVGSAYGQGAANAAGQLGGAAVQGVFLLPNNRKQESEADIVGQELMAKAGFDPQQAVNLWENMIQATGANGVLA